MKETTVPAQTQNQNQPNVATSGQAPQTTREERTLIPPVDIFEMNGDLAVVVDLPGVDKEHVEVHVDNNILTIRGMVQPEEQGEALYSEFQLRNFFRQFELSEEIDQDKIRADVKNGVLTIRLPKVEKAKPKKISVEVQG